MRSITKYLQLTYLMMKNEILSLQDWEEGKDVYSHHS